MKSNKQRKAEIKAARLKRVQKSKSRLGGINMSVHAGSIPADHEQLQHNPNYYLWPSFYINKPFVCRGCRSHEVWTAEQQKWWFEVAKGNLDSTAVRCRPCRRKKREEKALQKHHMAEMALLTPHPNEAFFKKRFF
jgi:hypothetical protein